MEEIRTRTVTWQDPMISSSVARTMSGIDFLHAIIRGEIPPPPIAVLLGFELLAAEPGRAVFGCQPAEYHYNPIGVVHGGLASILFDSAMGCSIQSTLPAGAGYSTIELHVNLIRSLTKDTGYVRCEAEALHVGRQVATAQARLVDADGKLYGHATTTCIIFQAESSGRTE